MLKKRETWENDKIHVRRIISYNWSFKIKQCMFKCPCIPFSGLFGCCSSCRTPLCCPSGLQHHRSCTDLGHTPSQPGSRDTVWCCTASYICSLGSGSDLKSRQNTWLHQLGREYSSNKHRAYKDYQLCCLAVHNMSQIKANLQGSTADMMMVYRGCSLSALWWLKGRTTVLDGVIQHCTEGSDMNNLNVLPAASAGGRSPF